MFDAPVQCSRPSVNCHIDWFHVETLAINDYTTCWIHFIIPRMVLYWICIKLPMIMYICTYVTWFWRVNLVNLSVLILFAIQNVVLITLASHRSQSWRNSTVRLPELQRQRCVYSQLHHLYRCSGHASIPNTRTVSNSRPCRRRCIHVSMAFGCHGSKRARSVSHHVSFDGVLNQLRWVIYIQVPISII